MGRTSRADILQLEVAKSEQQRRSSLTDVSHRLVDIAGKLDNSRVALAPWLEVKALKEEVAEMQRNIDEEIDDAAQQLGGAPKGGMLSRFSQTGALQKELIESQQQRRESLTEVSVNLTTLSARLDNAESSFLPWAEIHDAKQQLEHVQHIIAKQDLAQVDQMQDEKLCGA